MGLLAHQLSVDSDQQVSFPTLIWMSHEALPIASFSLAGIGLKEIESSIKNASAMVDHIWANNSKYAVQNSRANNELRQTKIDNFLLGESKWVGRDDQPPSIIPKSRNEIYRSSTRKIISYYDPISQTIDGLGGLMPSYSFQLVSQVNLSPQFTKQTRQRATIAFTESARNITISAAKDPISDDYFQAKRSRDWSLPIFSKTAKVQAELATALIQGGQATDHPSLIEEGIRIIKILESKWIPKNIAIEAPLQKELEAGAFLWSWAELEKIVTPEELTFLAEVFQLRKLGNIPATTDPTGKYFRLNTLQTNRSAKELADQLGLSQKAFTNKLSPMLLRLQNARNKKSGLHQETQLSSGQLAIVGNALLAGWAATNNEAWREKALKIASRIKKDFQDDGLLRFASPQKIHARGEDYAQCALFFESLYESTLKSQWLDATLAITEEAMRELSREGFLLQETRDVDQIIPLHIHSSRMIFGPSTIGLFDQIFTRLYAITGDQKFNIPRATVVKNFGSMINLSPVVATDFLRSFALGDEPCLITLAGDSSNSEYQKIHRALRNPQFSKYAILASTQSEALRKTPLLTNLNSNLKITLSQGDQIIGQANDLDSFTQLFLTQLAKKE